MLVLVTARDEGKLMAITYRIPHARVPTSVHKVRESHQEIGEVRSSDTM
jgi:hypothetical protein